MHMNNQPSPITGRLQNASAIIVNHAPPRESINETASANINRTLPCETMINNSFAIDYKISMSSRQERNEMVARPPQHISPCATKLTNASAKTLEPLPSSFQ